MIAFVLFISLLWTTSWCRINDEQFSALTAIFQDFNCQDCAVLDQATCEFNDYVQCSNDQITAITIKPAHNVNGVLSSRIGDLIDLKFLYLENEGLSGTIHENLGKLTDLLQL